MEHTLTTMFEREAVSQADCDSLYKNTEEELCFADARSQILSLMLRERYAIGRAYRKQGLLVNSFYVLRKGLQNFKLFAEGCSGIEDG